MREMTGQDQMNIVRKVTSKRHEYDCNIRSEVKTELVISHITHNNELIDELSEDVEYRYDHELDFMEMDRRPSWENKCITA